MKNSYFDIGYVDESKALIAKLEAGNTCQIDTLINDILVNYGISIKDILIHDKSSPSSYTLLHFCCNLRDCELVAKFLEQSNLIKMARISAISGTPTGIFKDIIENTFLIIDVLNAQKLIPLDSVFAKRALNKNYVTFDTNNVRCLKIFAARGATKKDYFNELIDRTKDIVSKLCAKLEKDCGANQATMFLNKELKEVINKNPLALLLFDGIPKIQLELSKLSDSVLANEISKKYKPNVQQSLNK